MRHFALALGVVALTACTDDVASDGSGDADETVGSDADDDDGDGESGDDGGTGGETFEPFDESDWARGDISIEHVEINQGTAITVIQNGEVVPADEHAGLVKDRNALVQAFWSVPAGWQARPILAKLHYRDINGDLHTLETTKTISGAPEPGSLDGSITWQMPAAIFTGNTEMFIELWEAGDATGIAASSESPSTPSGGMQPIGVTDEPMEAKVVLVPVQYNSGSCNTNTLSVIETNFEGFSNHFFSQNPIHTLDISIHPVGIVQETQLTTLSQINGALASLRFNDFAEPNVYYHAVVNACTGGVDDAGGLAPGTPGPFKGAGDLRVSTSLWLDFGFTSETIVHELGHNQGRPHSPCGGPDGPDPDYPYEAAAIGAWGFNVLTGQWFPPSRKDYMSYCNPTWVSDWTWGWVHEQVRQLSSWDYAGGAWDPDYEEKEILHGWVHPSGLEQWWTSPGELPPEMLTTAESVEFFGEGGDLIGHAPAASWVMDDGHTRYFMAEVPDSDLELVDAIVRVSKDVATPVPRAQVERRF